MVGTESRSRELRLALVCYGGVSLAIYMHGISKEILKLVRASRTLHAIADRSWRAQASFFDLADRDDPEYDTDDLVQQLGAADSEVAYFRQLQALAEAGTPVSVVVDVIAGTSAGGINGVCLGKVLATDGSQDELKRLWLTEGDLKTLLNSRRVGGWRTRAVLGGLRVPRYPLRGDLMSRLLYDALSKMDGRGGGSLVPAGGSLDLFVTTTDLHGYDVLVPTGAGGASQRDVDHAQVLAFRHSGQADGDNFGPDDTGALAFAARATSCFPGAFPPVSLASFAAELADGGRSRPLDPDRVAARFAAPYAETGTRAQDAWFVDGGVLDNAPFDLVVGAIAGKRAETEVIRRLVYIQPDPGAPLQPVDPPRGGSRAGPVPGWLPALWTAVGSAGTSHPILRELLRLRDLNIQIQQVGAIADEQMEQVLAILDAPDPVAAADQWPDTPPADPAPWPDSTFEEVKQYADLLYAAAQRLIGASYPTYCRLKLEAAGRALADEVAELFTYPPDSSRASFLRAVITAWAQRQEFWRNRDLATLGELLGRVDIPYRERRLLFILAGLRDLYPRCDQGAGTPTAAELNALKKAAWDLLDRVRAAPRDAVRTVQRPEFLSPQGLSEAAVYEAPERFAIEHEKELTSLLDDYKSALGNLVVDSSRQMWEDFSATTGHWSPDYRRQLLARYIGFPLWDALIFPTIALSNLPQFTPIGVSQFSPVTARALRPLPNARGKLMGTSWHHFGAFMDAEWRGRVDGAELILRTLRSSVDATVPDTTTAEVLDSEQAARGAGPYFRLAVERILESESDLGRVGQLRANLAGQVEKLP